VQNLQTLLKLLIHSPIDFVLVGGFAAVLHGSNQITRDIDICVIHSPDQIRALQDLLKPFHPVYRKQEQTVSFLEAPKNLSTQQDFHLSTDLGILDIITHVKGVGDYYDVLRKSETMQLFAGSCCIISIDDLIKSKKALGRHRDLVVVEELEAILKEK
jgi:hypothetical protein